MKFTDTSIKALKPKSERHEVWESNGRAFGVRVSASGRKSFIYLYRFNGLSRRMTFGIYPEMRLVEAHAVHGIARELLSKGIDPGDEKKSETTAYKEAPTMKDLVDE